MTANDIMIKTNHHLIKGGVLNEHQKTSIGNELLSECTSRTTSLKENMNSNGRCMYPIYYIPPQNDYSKLRTVLNQKPKTKIFSANMYELEILRLLYLLIPDNKQVVYMINETLERLKTTCFGYLDDGVGECFDTSLIVLRFLNTVADHETEWIQSRIDNYKNHVNDRKRPWYCNWYYWLCLSEMPFETVKYEVDQYKDVMLDYLIHKSFIMNSTHDRMIHPVLMFILRNVISKYPEYNYIKNNQPYVSDKNGRLYFDMLKS